MTNTININDIAKQKQGRIFEKIMLIYAMSENIADILLRMSSSEKQKAFQNVKKVLNSIEDNIDLFSTYISNMDNKSFDLNMMEKKVKMVMLSLAEKAKNSKESYIFTKKNYSL